MAESPRIIMDNASLRAQYHELGPGDCIVGPVRMRTSEEPMLLDLLDRGVRMMPPALAQLASRSKTMQARLFAPDMLKHTLSIHDRHDLREGLNRYGAHGIDRVVTKHDRRHAGLGIHLWASAEEVYSQASLQVLPLPFVLQPFVAGGRDIRVIIIGEFVEAYWRTNPNSFRNNLHCGGETSPCDLSATQTALCRRVMGRGRFPYAHIDLMVTPDNATFLSEINLRGGIKGARVSQEEYRARMGAVHQRWLEEQISG